MAANPRDTTQDWIVSEAATPPTIAELEDRVDVAIAIARSSEAAVMTVADAAIESAEQARRAAALAERAVAIVARSGAAAAPEANGRAAALPPEEEWLLDFSRRAHEVEARFAGLAA